MMENISRFILLSCLVSRSAMAGDGEIYTPEGYSDFASPGLVVLDRPMDIVKDRLAAFPRMLEGAPRLELKSYLDRGDRLVIDVTQTGLLDDSINGTNHRYVFKQAKQGKQSNYVLWSYGYRQRCVRSEKVDEWVTTPCP